MDRRLATAEDRQGPSSLYTFRKSRSAVRHVGLADATSAYPRQRLLRQERTTCIRSSRVTTYSQGLARDCSRSRDPGSPNLTPFTPAVSEPGAQIAQVPCVYQFRHPGTGRAEIVRHGRLLVASRAGREPWLIHCAPFP